MSPSIHLDRLRGLMMDSRHRWRTLRVHGTERRDPVLLTEAFRRSIPPGATWISGVATSDGPVSQDTTWDLRIALPDRIRTDFLVGGEGVTAVFEGATWWSVSSFAEPLTNDGNPKSGHGKGPGYPLTEPRRLVSSLELEPGEETTVAGRAAVQVLGTPVVQSGRDLLDRLAAEDVLGDFGLGADVYRFAVDLERGLILRSEAMFAGQPFLVIEVQDVGFDEAFPDDTFKLQPPPGTSFRNTRPARGRRPSLG